MTNSLSEASKNRVCHLVMHYDKVTYFKRVINCLLSRCWVQILGLPEGDTTKLGACLLFYSLRVPDNLCHGKVPKVVKGC